MRSTTTTIPLLALSLLILPAALSFSTNSGKAFRNTPRTFLPHLSQSSSSSSTDIDNTNTNDEIWASWAKSNGISTPKLTIRTPTSEERGKGGVYASESISALEVVATIPSNLAIIASSSQQRAIEAATNAKNFSWALDLTAATLATLHPTNEELSDVKNGQAISSKQSWISSWNTGGWATNGADLGNSKWGADGVTGSLMSTGSDNDHNIYAKFRMPCHPAVFRSSVGLAMLTNSEEEEALDALLLRGRVYRSMRDALAPLVANPTERKKGSINERKKWDVADTLSKVLARATMVQVDGKNGESTELTGAIIPIHERLGQCDDERGENVKVILGDDDTIKLVAIQNIEAGETITRDYNTAPRLDGDDTDGALRLLLQFGLPPSAWQKS